MTHENLDIAETAQAAATAAAAWILNELREVTATGPARIAISGGSTPKLMFEILAKTPFPWNKVHLFWVDERCVPPGDPQSNYGVAKKVWLEPAQIPAENIHRIQGELEPTRAASEYVAQLKRVFALEGDAIPVFDIVHRGMGDDAHTASLFPGEPLINDRKGIAAAVYVEKVKMHRVTLLPAALKAARKTVMLVAGEDKAEPLCQVLRGPEDPMKYPCQIATRGALNAIWFTDRAAVARL